MIKPSLPAACNPPGFLDLGDVGPLNLYKFAGS